MWIRTNYRFAMDGETLHEGSTGTVVLVHGAWHGSWCWEQWREPLEAAGFNVHAFDLPGHGEPGRRKRLWTPLSAYVKALDDVVQELGPDVAIVGHSMGGLVVQRFLEARTIRQAVLLASVPRFGATGATLRQLRQDPMSTMRSIFTLDMWPLVRTPERVRRAFFTESSSEANVQWTAAHIQNESYIAYLSMMLRWSRPSKVTTPVAVIAAEGDAVFTLAEQRSLAAAYGAELVILPGAGHDAMLDDSAVEAAAVVAELIAVR